MSSGLCGWFRGFFGVLVAMSGLLAACGEDAASTPDSAMPDSGAPPDAGLDSGLDGSMDGSTPMDGTVPDTGMPDTGAPDGEVDAGPDAEADAGSDAALPIMPPTHLSETGLYLPGSLSELADGVMAYTPRYALWSDGADKQRYLFLPEGTTIDTSDPDAFVFPIGTKAWKEFALDGKRLETRLLWKTDNGWYHVAYAWNEAQDDAIATTRGAADVLGTDHDIPTRAQCRDCHGGAADTLLGVSAIQLAHDDTLAGINLGELQAQGWLSDAPPANLERPDTLEWNALGYLHANCGNCHNPRGLGYDRVDMDLWLRASELDAVTSTQSYMTTVDVTPEQTAGDDTARVEPGIAEDSVVITRMKLRDDEKAMPPMASELVDDAGVALIEDWIDSL